MLFTLAFWRGLAERAAKTFAQAFGAAILASEVPGLIELDWMQMLSIAGLATLLSTLTSISNPEFVTGAEALSKVRAEARQEAVAEVLASVERLSLESEVGEAADPDDVGAPKPIGFDDTPVGFQVRHTA